MYIGLLADTHIPGASESLPLRLKEVFSGIDLILHAGDIYTASVLDELEELAPVFAAKGDDDYVLDRRVKEKHSLTVAGVRIHLVHKMPASLFRAWMGDRSQDAKHSSPRNVLVFGHTHCPIVSSFKNTLLINPGSPTFPIYPYALGTVGILNIRSDRTESVIVHL